MDVAVLGESNTVWYIYFSLHRALFSYISKVQGGDSLAQLGLNPFSGINKEAEGWDLIIGSCGLSAALLQDPL